MICPLPPVVPTVRWSEVRTTVSPPQPSPEEIAVKYLGESPGKGLVTEGHLEISLVEVS